jgi:hypothetical protein
VRGGDSLDAIIYIRSRKCSLIFNPVAVTYYFVDDYTNINIYCKYIEYLLIKKKSSLKKKRSCGMKRFFKVKVGREEISTFYDVTNEK